MIRKHWIIISLIFLAIGISCFIFKDCFEKYERIISIVGSFASLFGIIVAIVQAYQAKTAADVAAQASKDAKEATEETNKLVDEGMLHVKKIISLVDISQILHIPNEIQDSIQRKDWERAFEKMRNLKDFMIDVQNSPIMEENRSLKNELVVSTQKLTLRINSFGEAIKNKTEPFGADYASELMETIRTQLKTISAKIKYSSNI